MKKASSESFQNILCVLKLETDTAIKWFVDNVMEANDYKLYFMPLHCSLIPKAAPLADFEIHDCGRLTAEPDVKLRGLGLD